jgi:transcriptional regulator with XRE-family HTH domain
MTRHLRLISPQDTDTQRDQFYSQVGAKMKEARESAHLSQGALAQQMGVTQGHLCEMESGNRYRLGLYPVALAAQALLTSMDAWCGSAPHLDYSAQRTRWLLLAYARLSEQGQAFLVDTAIELTRFMPQGSQ